ncbi:MAG: CDP-glucose 4,6-dehydratase [Spirochaetia bacterium]
MGVDQAFWKDKSVFLTGHTGFKGSWMTALLEFLQARVVGFSLPLDVQPAVQCAHFSLLKSGMQSYWGDIADLQNISYAIKATQPEIVFHFAAQAIVKTGYIDPISTYATNVMGTLNVLEAVRQACSSVKAVVIVTTDKCYENKEWIWPYREVDRLGGVDPYSSSKACAEIVTKSYRDSYFSLKNYGQSHHTLVATARAGNVLGGGDWSENRLIPDIARAWRAQTPLVLRHPAAVRPWQHVLESLNGYMLLAQRLYAGEVRCADAYNFGPDDQSFASVDYIVSQAQAYLPGLSYHIEKSDFHEAQQLRLDSSKARADLGFAPVWPMPKTIQKTLDWYRRYYEDAQVSTLENIKEYLREVTGD